MATPLENLQRSLLSEQEYLQGIVDPERRRRLEESIFEKQMQVQRMQGTPWSGISGLRYGPPTGHPFIPSVTGYGTSYDAVPTVGSVYPGDTGGAWANMRVDVMPDGMAKVTNTGPETALTEHFRSKVESGEMPLGEARAKIAHSKREKGVSGILAAEKEVSELYGTPTPREDYTAATKAFQAEKAAIPEKAPTKANLGDINVDDPYDPTGKRAKAGIAGVDFSGKFSRALPLGLGLGLGAALAPEEAWAAPFSQDGLNYWGGTATGLDLAKAAFDPSRLSPFSIGATLAEDTISGLGQLTRDVLETRDVQPGEPYSGMGDAPDSMSTGHPGMMGATGYDLSGGLSAQAYPSMDNVYTDPTAMAYAGVTPPGEEFGSSYAGPNTMGAGMAEVVPVSIADTSMMSGVNYSPQKSWPSRMAEMLIDSTLTSPGIGESGDWGDHVARSAVIEALAVGEDPALSAKEADKWKGEDMFNTLNPLGDVVGAIAAPIGQLLEGDPQAALANVTPGVPQRFIAFNDMLKAGALGPESIPEVISQVDEFGAIPGGPSVPVDSFPVAAATPLAELQRQKVASAKRALSTIDTGAVEREKARMHELAVQQAADKHAANVAAAQAKHEENLRIAELTRQAAARQAQAAREVQASKDRVRQANTLMSSRAYQESGLDGLSAAERDIVAAAQVDTFAGISDPGQSVRDAMTEVGYGGFGPGGGGWT